MKHQLWFSAVGWACLGSTVVAQERFGAEWEHDTMLKRRNRFSLKATFNFNIKSHFTSTTPAGSGAFPRVGPEHRSYADGFVGVDEGGNGPNPAGVPATLFWQYDNASQVSASDPVLGGLSSLAFHSVGSLADGATRSSRDKAQPGLELTYEEVLGRFQITDRRRANVGLQASLGYLRLGQRESGSLAGLVPFTRDTYDTSGILPGAGFPAPGTPPITSGAGPLLPDAPADLSPVGGTAPATSTVSNQLEGSLYGLNLGPFIEFPLLDRVSLTLAGGLGVVHARTRYNYRETTVVAPNPLAPAGLTTTRAGRVTAADWLFSATVKANLYVALTEAWSWEFGLAYQTAGNSRATVQGKTANLQLDNILSVNTGLNYAF